MRHVFRHYRQVRVVSQGDSTRPQVRGVEEIWCDGQGQVRYWSDREPPETKRISGSPLFDLLRDSWSGFDSFPAGEPWYWEKTDSTSRFPRYINPNDVVIETNGSTIKKSAWDERLSKFRQALTERTKTVGEFVRRLPSALKAAWRELNRTE